MSKHAGGRPRVAINWEEFDKLCGLQCTLGEIASWFDCSPDTIERAVNREKNTSFADYFAKKRCSGMVSLRRAQYQAATKGNATMLIWLGKQWLGQRDTRQESTITIDDKRPVRNRSMAELDALIDAGEIAIKSMTNK